MSWNFGSAGVYRHPVVTRAPAPAVAALDLGAAGAALVKVINETENVTEATLALLTLVRLVAETENIPEAVAALLTMVRLTNETEQVTEATLALRTLVRFANEMSESRSFAGFRSKPICFSIKRVIRRQTLASGSSLILQSA